MNAIPRKNVIALTYPVVRYLNNCRHYASKSGAEIGDYVTSLTMLALLSGRNPIKYLEHLLANEVELKENDSSAFLPWEISSSEVPELEKNWFTNWIPQPSARENKDNPADSREASVS